MDWSTLTAEVAIGVAGGTIVMAYGMLRQTVQTNTKEIDRLSREFTDYKDTAPQKFAERVLLDRLDDRHQSSVHALQIQITDGFKALSERLDRIISGGIK